MRQTVRRMITRTVYLQPFSAAHSFEATTKMAATKTQAEPQEKTPAAAVVSKQPATPEKANGPQASTATATSSPSPPPNGASSPMRGNAGAAPRARGMMTLQRSVGNNRAGRIIQTKLMVSAVDDPHEREADNVAETITQPNNTTTSAVRPLITRLAQPTATPEADHENVDAGMEQCITSAGGGQPLPTGLQREMEAKLNADFSQVRVHDNAQDQTDATHLGAKAFTHESNIWLGAGQSSNDRKLMAHELTHVVQQGASSTLTNQSVNRMVSPNIMRFVGTEHRALGDTTGATVDLGDNIILTWGQVVAIAGDEYGTVEELQNAVSTPDGRARLRAALEHDGVPGTVTTRLPAPTPTQASTQATEFIVLAMQNVTHFPDAGAALAAWAHHHRRAIDAAVRAGLANNPRGIAEAYLLEAFGQHFLTDAFCGGHIRTPRTQMVNWYTTVFAPRVIGRLIASLRTRLIEGLVAQANPQNPNTPEILIRRRIAPRVDTAINDAINVAGGLPTITRWIGLGVAGAISGAIHDAEGATGVLVSSDEHPVPWRAFGDDRLADSPISREQASRAVAAAKADVDRAYSIGEAEAFQRTISAENPPERVHFPFNSSALDPAAARAVQTAAAQMIYNPEARVRIVGHTDPIGLDRDNDALGLRRANAIQDALVQAGIAPDRITTRSEGERLLLTTDPRRFRLNRRAEFSWRSEPQPLTVTDPQGIARRRAEDKARAEFRPPYPNVTRFVPRPVEERGGSGNTPLSDWHWGNLTPATRALVDDWIRRNVGTRLQDVVSSARQLNDITEGDTTVRPRPIVSAIVTQLMANPTATLGDLIGERPGPP